VTVEVSGRGGGRAARTWDVGVVPPTPPVLEEVTPPAGPVALAQGVQGSFRCRARVPAALPGDRLAFEWMLDDRPVRREDSRQRTRSPIWPFRLPRPARTTCACA